MRPPRGGGPAALTTLCRCRLVGLPPRTLPTIGQPRSCHRRPFSPSVSGHTPRVQTRSLGTRQPRSKTQHWV
ncbi:hypothetical protein LZ32DRAFT_597970 [Colletotrichum eremochloae]|nr:hypothetical protein LZ32DRAFT_597970 [Colletotrichum eremochloae]